jgi:cytochrome P450 family 619
MDVHDEMLRLYADLVNRVRKRREEHGSKDSLIDVVLDGQEKFRLNEHQLCFLGGVAMDGGSDTTGATMLNFMKAMTCYPHVQKKAQAEIDGLIDDSRSPTWSEYSSLPYVSAVVKETMRWRPVGGLIPPHATSQGENLPPCNIGWLLRCRGLTTSVPFYR